MPFVSELSFYEDFRFLQATGDVRVRIEVHANRILELESDKTFFISCTQNGILGE